MHNVEISGFQIELKSDLRGIETQKRLIDCEPLQALKSDLRGIETYHFVFGTTWDNLLKSDLRGIETLKRNGAAGRSQEVKIRP